MKEVGRGRKTIYKLIDVILLKSKNPTTCTYYIYIITQSIITIYIYTYLIALEQVITN